MARQVGFIKWYGGFNSHTGRENEFGFISLYGEPDLFVHRSQVLTSETNLTENALVTFDIEKNPKNGKLQARNLKLLSEETDSHILEECFNSDEPILWRAITHNYLSGLSVNEAVEKTKKRISQLLNEDYRTTFVSYVPDTLLAIEAAQPLWEHLSLTRLLQITTNPSGRNANFSFMLETEIKERLKALSVGNTISLSLDDWQKVPEPVVLDAEIWNIVPPTLRIKLLAQQYGKADSEDEIASQLVNNLKLLSESERKAALGELKPEIRHHPQVIPFLPLTEQLAFILQSYTSVSDEQLILKVINILSKDRSPTLISQLPITLKAHPQIFELLDNENRLDALLYKLGFCEESNAIEVLITQIAEILSKEKGSSLSDKIPLSIKAHRAIFPHLKVEDKVETLVRRYREGEDIEQIVDVLEALLQEVSNDSLEDIWLDSPIRSERDTLIQKLPQELQNHQRIFALLSPVEQVETKWDALQANSTTWHLLSREAKVLCAFRFAAEDTYFFDDTETDPIAQAVLLLLWVRRQTDTTIRNEVFNRAHNKILDFVVQQAFTSSNPISLDYLLPSCPNNVIPYCEARLWLTKEQKEKGITRTPKVYCPRANTSCKAEDLIQSTEDNRMDFYHYKGARLYSNTSRHWTEWSLLELLEYAGVVPKVDELEYSDEYITRLSGWVNRLNEIRARLKCRVCGEIMKSHYRYAKNLARYNSTIVTCRHGGNHDTNVYLNHCWACGKIIDSRDDTVQVEGFYICLQCGSGPQKHQTKTYTQGDICPKCSFPNMIREDSGDTCVCRNCQHQINLPPKNKLTGVAEKH